MDFVTETASLSYTEKYSYFPSMRRGRLNESNSVSLQFKLRQVLNDRDGLHDTSSCGKEQLQITVAYAPLVCKTHTRQCIQVTQAVNGGDLGTGPGTRGQRGREHSKFYNMNALHISLV